MINKDKYTINTNTGKVKNKLENTGRMNFFEFLYFKIFEWNYFMPVIEELLEQIIEGFTSLIAIPVAPFIFIFLSYEEHKCNTKSYKRMKELENNTRNQFIKSVPRSDSLTLDLIEKMVEILRVIKKHKHNREYDLKNYCKEELYLTEEQYVKIINELIRLKKITIEYHVYCPRCDECYGYYDSKDKIPKEMFCEECDQNISEDYYVIKYFV